MIGSIYQPGGSSRLPAPVGVGRFGRPGLSSSLSSPPPPPTPRRIRRSIPLQFSSTSSSLLKYWLGITWFSSRHHSVFNGCFTTRAFLNFSVQVSCGFSFSFQQEVFTKGDFKIKIMICIGCIRHYTIATLATLEHYIQHLYDCNIHRLNFCWPVGPLHTPLLVLSLAPVESPSWKISVSCFLELYFLSHDHHDHTSKTFL